MNRIGKPLQDLWVDLPRPDRTLERFQVSAPGDFPHRAIGKLNRIALAAAHVVSDPFADNNPWLDCAIDWDRTIAYREYLWALGLAVAEGMDTAQRGMGVDWPTSLELIRRSVSAARACNGIVFSGCGTDQLEPSNAKNLADVVRAYEEQIEAIEAVGGRIVLMASRALARVARSPDDYAHVYGRILAGVRQPVIIHWLGDMFDPALAGYWGSSDVDKAMDTAVAIVNANANKVDGVKVSLLDKDKEIAMRRRLAAGVLMYTGDDFNYAELIAGDGQGYSHALLGIFDVIAPAASAALIRLAANDRKAFYDILAPTVPLSRHIFISPTRFYKTGVVFMAYLNGHQDHFTLIGGQESARSILHLAQIFRLADAAGLLREPQLAVARMRHVLTTHGVGV